jgi:hypothetical protein
MRFNFRKISALASSALMVGMTMGVAAAANYPAPFVSGGTANVAIVYGTGAGVSALDVVQAGNIQSSLQGYMTGTGSSTTTVTGGDSIKLEKSSDKFNLGDSASSVFVTSIDDDDLATLLTEGTYVDDDNADFDFTQKVNLGSNLVLEHFSDSDYDDLIGASDKTPSLGFQFSGDEHILNYTLDFVTHPEYGANKLETTDMVLMGKTYYVLDVTNTTTNKTTLLDSAASAIITEGSSSTVAGKSVSIEYIGSTEVRLTLDGETTNSLAEGATYKLTDGTYVGIKDILYDAKDTGISKVEMSLGTGKLELTDHAAIELNDDTVDEIIAFLEQDSSEQLDKIVLQWTTDDEEFLTPESDLVMPGFGALKFTMADMNFPASETTTIDISGSDVLEIKTVLTDGAVTIPILAANSSGDFEYIGKDSSNILLTSTSIDAVRFNESANDQYFVGSWNSTADSESYYIEAKVISENSVNKVSFKNKITLSEKKIQNGSDADFGSVTITVNNITKDTGNENFIMTLNAGGSLNKIYTAEGLKLHLPYSVSDDVANVSATAASKWGAISLNAVVNASTGHTFDSWYLYFEEEDKDGNLGAGGEFNMTLDEAAGTGGKVHVNAVSTDSSGLEIGNTDDIEYFQVSDLATRVLHDTGGDQDTADVRYAGDQAFADVFLSAPDVTVSGGGVVTSGGTLGEVLVKDSEVSSVSTKNLVIVGGSCINSAAANVLGGAYCGAAFTTATGVGSGQFLIQSFGDAYATGKIALLVAGYEAADTVNAATYLRTQVVDTTAAMKYKGTSSTSAELVVE